MVYIIGVGHSVQCDKKLSFSITKEFINDLRQLVVNSGIKLIAEEFSLEALSKQPLPLSSTITEDIANKLNINHKYCDPDSKEREIIGWHSASDDMLRLINWLEKIVDKLSDPIVFICGNQHVKGFAKIIEDKGQDVSIYPKVYMSKKDTLHDKYCLFEKTRKSRAQKIVVMI